MRAWTATAILVIGVVLTHAAPAAAQLPPPAPAAPGPAAAPPPAATPAPGGDLPPPAPAAGITAAPAAPSALSGGDANGGLPPPQPGNAVVTGQNLTGTPNPTELAPAHGDEWRFSFHGFSRYPMRVGIGNRPGCPAGQPAGTNVSPSGVVDMNSPTQIPCAGPGQSHTALHTPMAPDTQYLDWRYDRQQEYDWTELFFNYGNSIVTGTVGIEAFGFSDAEYINFSNAATQLGIAQAYLTIHPDLGVAGLRLTAKVGSFWDKYGMASQYDAGKYDTYMFGRTHQMGETIAAEYAFDDYTFRLSHGIGTRAEQVAFTQLQYGLPTFPAGSENNYPGFTLLHHAHAGVSYKKVIDFNAHYLTSWAQDYRAVGVANGQTTDGHIDVYGAEVTAKMGPLGGRLYFAYSHMLATNPQAVGPVVEAVHSLGGGNYESGNGILDNFLGCTNAGGSGTANSASGNCETVQNSMGATHGSVDSIEVQYEYGLGTLIKRLADSQGQWDAYLALFGMYSSVSSMTNGVPLTPGTTGPNSSGTYLLGDGVQKLKYGADLIITPLPWLGFGARTDIVQPTNQGKPEDQRFWVISPKVMFKTKWVTHEEVTVWYSHYTYGAGVLPQPPNGVANPNAGNSPQTPVGPFPPDENVVGLKGTVWW